ncbi:MAG: fibrobacter succinogenes major paralogous domain-containing protein [Saprospiraceae bacterium]|nr:fibrobacter succinogenes major paralogous domain-containing protein [Candidatus Vicinibacter affinis]
MKKILRVWICLIAVLGLMMALSNSCKKDKENSNNNPTVTDIDGNVYHTVTIGSQTWMVENLNTSRYRDSTLIPNVTDNLAWISLTTGAFCDYENLPSNSKTYGKLYNWYAVTDSHNICPIGWHIPSDAEWTTLTDFLGGENTAGGKLKEAGTTHWQSPNYGATNESGFTALPGGRRNSDGSFENPLNKLGIRYDGAWWTSTLFGMHSIWYRSIGYSGIGVGRNDSMETNGFSIRCIKD